MNKTGSYVFTDFETMWAANPAQHVDQGQTMTQSGFPKHDGLFDATKSALCPLLQAITDQYHFYAFCPP